jgi:hypothetical protein
MDYSKLFRSWEYRFQTLKQFVSPSLPLLLFLRPVSVRINSEIVNHRQSLELLGWSISLPPTSTSTSKERRHPRLEWGSNAQSQCLNRRRHRSKYVSAQLSSNLLRHPLFSGIASILLTKISPLLFPFPAISLLSFWRIPVPDWTVLFQALSEAFRHFKALLMDLSAVSLLHLSALHRNPLAVVFMVPGGSPQFAWLCCVSRHRAFALPLTTIAGESGFGKHNLTIQCSIVFTAAHIERLLGSNNGKKKLSLILYINYCFSLHLKSTLCRNKFISLMMLLQTGIFPTKS